MKNLLKDNQILEIACKMKKMKNVLVLKDNRIVGTPKFRHNCDQCVFLGTYENRDMYFCSQSDMPTVIARYGNADHQYVSGKALAQRNFITQIGVTFGSLHIAYLIARDLKLIE